MHDYTGYLKVIRALAKEQSLTLTLTDNADEHPRTNGKQLILPRPDPLFSAMDWQLWHDACWHEIGHNLAECKDIFPLVREEKINMRSLFGVCLNIAEDFRVDDIRTRKYWGMREANIAATEYYVTKLSTTPLNIEQNGVRELLTINAFDCACREVNDTELKGLSELWQSRLDEKGLQWLAQLKARFVKRYTTPANAQDVLDTTRDIFSTVFERDSKDCGDGTEGASEGASEASGDSESGDGDERTGNEEKHPGDSPRTVEYADILKHPHTEKGKGPTASKIKYSVETDGDYQPHSDSTTVEFNFNNGETNPDAHNPIVSTRDIQNFIDQLKVDSLISAARRLLQAKTRKRYTFNLRAGKLDVSKLHRITNEGAASERIFKNKLESTALDTAVSLLVDYSGSMISCQKMAKAAASAYALARLFTVLRVPHEILGFSEAYTDSNYLYIFKSFSSTPTESKLLESMSQASGNMANNCDGDSILCAYSRLIKQRTARKVLIVLSDGSPCGGIGDIDAFTRKIVKAIENANLVDIIGIGIESTEVERIYKHHCCITDASTLPSKLIEVLENVLLQRNLK